MKRLQHLVYKPIIAIIFFALIIIQVYLSNSISTYGAKLSSLENDISLLSKQNEDLEQEIASSSSVTTISAKAQLIGLTMNPTTLSLHSPLPLALSNLIPN